jgi:glucuronate isomerase
MKTFISDNFLLETETARELYTNYAAPQPIFDYHCHLPPQQIAENYRFRNLYDIWLGGDHYKWRAMRSNGVSEDLCTGKADDYDKYLAFVRTVPYTLRNPLYHWSHLELLRYFGIDQIIEEKSAKAIWDQANTKLKTADLSVLGILKKNKVAAICTTDDPTDSLDFHGRVKRLGIDTRVYPTFRPDKALTVNNPSAFAIWCDKLAAVTEMDCSAFSSFLDAIKKRHDYFHKVGCRLSDHGLECVPLATCTEKEAARIFNKARSGAVATPDETAKFVFFMLVYFGQLDAARGWTKQLHLGALRNNNSRLFNKLGPDIGCDSIGDFPQARALSRYLDKLDSTNQLPKIILYNLNPADNYVLATMLGNFQDGSLAGKIQFGSGWWFLDQKEAMEWQINALSNLGLLRRFVGMLTDSRSFLSYTRHEYFRRILCNMIGNDVQKGLLPKDIPLLGAMVKEISFTNAKNFFGLELSDKFAK